MATVEFYFDYLSPYAYLASLEIGPLCRRHGAELDTATVTKSLMSWVYSLE